MQGLLRRYFAISIVLISFATILVSLAFAQGVVPSILHPQDTTLFRH